MKTKIPILLMLGITLVNLLNAQTNTLDWSSSFSPAWAAGNTTGDANNIGGSSVNATVSLISPEITALSSVSTLFTSPRISLGGNPFTTQLGSNVPNLAVGMNLLSLSNYVDIVINFNNYSVSDVKFNIADIDRLSFAASNYFDEVEITGTNGGVPVTNPSLTKLVAGSNFFTIAGNVASSNTSFFSGGNSAASTTDQNGTVVVDFGTTVLTQITIRYRNGPVAIAPLGEQAIAIGNIAFSKVSLLPVKLASFNYIKQKQGLLLQWQAAEELNVKEYVIEKSYDGINFSALNTVPAQNLSDNKGYTYTDKRIANTTIFYRLKTNDYNGNYNYSNILVVKEKDSNEDNIVVSPNPVINNVANVFIPTQLINKSVLIRLIGQDGKVILQQHQVLYANTMALNLPKHFHGIGLVEMQQTNNKSILYQEKILVR